MRLTRVYLSPGLFGFARLAGVEYFQHVRAGLEQRFRDRAQGVEIRVFEAPPTASLRRRASELARLIDESGGSDDGAIHLLGHSTGGLDVRLVASPSARLEEGASRDWIDRLCSVTTLNSPHYGTPLAAFFATAKGQRLLYAVSAITVAALRLGAPPLVATSALVAALARTPERVGLELGLIDRIIAPLLRALDEAGSSELQNWLHAIRDDQGAILQLAPEAMDLFHAGVENREGLRYQCVASYAPPGRARDWLHHARSPWGLISAALFHLLYGLTSVRDPRYPCAPFDLSDEALGALLGDVPPAGANDGVVPFRSQLWGTPVWAGRADHLDVVGYFRGRGGHRDWLSSGSRFDHTRFAALLDGVVDGMLESERTRAAPAA